MGAREFITWITLQLTSIPFMGSRNNNSQSPPATDTSRIKLWADVPQGSYADFAYDFSRASGRQSPKGPALIITPGLQSHEIHHTAHYEKDQKLSF